MFIIFSEKLIKLYQEKNKFKFLKNIVLTLYKHAYGPQTCNLPRIRPTSKDVPSTYLDLRTHHSPYLSLFGPQDFNSLDHDNNSICSVWPGGCASRAQGAPCTVTRWLGGTV